MEKLNNANASVLMKSPLDNLHLELGAKMVTFAGYSMPLHYKSGIMTEHLHTREAAGLFDISHMGQISVSGVDAAKALETVLPMDVIGLSRGKQRYALLLNDDGGILDDLMVFNKGEDSWFLVVNGACKLSDIEYIIDRIGSCCTITPMLDHALLALQGPKSAQILSSFDNNIANLLFMEGDNFSIASCNCFVTRSGYTGEDGFEISVSSDRANILARALLDFPQVQPVGLGARNSLRLEAGLCLYGNDMNKHISPSEASLAWSIPKIRRKGGLREGGFPGCKRVLSELDGSMAVLRKRVGLMALAPIPVRERAKLYTLQGEHIGEVTSGLFSPSINRPIAMGYVKSGLDIIGAKLNAIVRANKVEMEVVSMPFVPNRYFRG